MSTKANHMARSHRSSARSKSAFSSMGRHAYCLQSEDYTGKNLAAKLALFHTLIARRRKAAKKDADK